MAATATREPFPWQQVMGIAFGLLRLSPRDFWAMSPLELAAALNALGAGSGGNLGREEFEQLMKLFPDGSSGGH